MVGAGRHECGAVVGPSIEGNGLVFGWGKKSFGCDGFWVRTKWLAGGGGWGAVITSGTACNGLWLVLCAVRVAGHEGIESMTRDAEWENEAIEAPMKFVEAAVMVLGWWTEVSVLKAWRPQQGTRKPRNFRRVRIETRGNEKKWKN